MAKRTIVINCDEAVGVATIRAVMNRLQSGGVPWISEHQVLEECGLDPAIAHHAEGADVISLLIQTQRPDIAIIFTCRDYGTHRYLRDCGLGGHPWETGAVPTGVRVLTPADVLSPEILDALIAEYGKR